MRAGRNNVCAYTDRSCSSLPCTSLYFPVLPFPSLPIYRLPFSSFSLAAKKTAPTGLASVYNSHSRIITSASTHLFTVSFPHKPPSNCLVRQLFAQLQFSPAPSQKETRCASGATGILLPAPKARYSKSRRVGTKLQSLLGPDT